MRYLVKEGIIIFPFISSTSQNTWRKKTSSVIYTEVAWPSDFYTLKICIYKNLIIFEKMLQFSCRICTMTTFRSYIVATVCTQESLVTLSPTVTLFEYINYDIKLIPKNNKARGIFKYLQFFDKTHTREIELLSWGPIY